jgi:hypothetical protein
MAGYEESYPEFESKQCMGVHKYQHVTSIPVQREVRGDKPV